MRILLAVATLAGIAMPGVASAQVYATDPYAPGAYYEPGAVVIQQPPLVSSQVYMGPGAAYVAPIAPGTAYTDNPIFINGERYYRDCWWDWGQRRCELKRWW